MKEYAIIPRPKSVQYKTDIFECPGLPRIIELDKAIFPDEVKIFERQITEIFGTCTGKENIHLIKDESIRGNEAYRLEILRDEIKLYAAAGAGIFRGLQVLRQLFLSDYNNGIFSVTCGIINDSPRFPWRGFMLDCSRHFFTTDFIKKILDTLSLQHISIFHWHLTDDQGWRFPVGKYPLLTEIGGRCRDYRDRRYNGGFYTEDEIRDIVAYAASLHIETVPEVDLPGHASAILAAYPGLGCTGGPYRVEDRCGIFEDVLCAGNDQIFSLAEAVFDTLSDLFPSKYVHIGGDEVRFNRWKACPKCRKRMNELGLDETPQLQSWITCRLAEMLRDRGKTAIGWDEILENTGKFPVPKDTVVMSWRGQKGGSEAAVLGHRVIMTPYNCGCYLDYRHKDLPEEIGRLGIGTVEQGYNMDPVTAEMDEKAAALVLGGQGNLWTENVFAGKLAEYLIFPRICGISEALWSVKDERDFNNFTERLEIHRRRLDKLGLLQYRGPLS